MNKWTAVIAGFVGLFLAWGYISISVSGLEYPFLSEGTFLNKCVKDPSFSFCMDVYGIDCSNIRGTVADLCTISNGTINNSLFFGGHLPAYYEGLAGGFNWNDLTPIFVNRTGDIMTGNLNVSVGNIHYNMTSTGFIANNADTGGKCFITPIGNVDGTSHSGSLVVLAEDGGNGITGLAMTGGATGVYGFANGTTGSGSVAIYGQANNVEAIYGLTIRGIAITGNAQGEGIAGKFLGNITWSKSAYGKLGWGNLTNLPDFITSGDIFVNVTGDNMIGDLNIYSGTGYVNITAATGVIEAAKIGVGMSPTKVLDVYELDTTGSGIGGYASTFRTELNISPSVADAKIYYAYDAWAHTDPDNTQDSSGSIVGVYGHVDWEDSGTNTGWGVGGFFDADKGAGGTVAVNVGVYGSATDAILNYAGYFGDGNVYIANNLGIGTDTPTSTLTVQGDAVAYSGTGYVNITAATGMINTSGNINIMTDTLVVTGSRVGIGFAAPSTAGLSIDPNSNIAGIRLFGTAQATEIADIYVGSAGQLVLSTTNTGDTAPFIEVDAEDDQYGLIIRDSNTGSSVFANLFMTDAAADYLAITVDSATGVHGVVITDSNLVGIGKVPTVSKLEVSGSVNITNDLTVDGDITIDGVIYPDIDGGASLGAPSFNFLEVHVRDIIFDAGDNYAINFWDSSNYNIRMTDDEHALGGVTSYAIVNEMSDNDGRGFLWVNAGEAGMSLESFTGQWVLTVRDGINVGSGSGSINMTGSTGKLEVSGFIDEGGGGRTDTGLVVWCDGTDGDTDTGDECCAIRSMACASASEYSDPAVGISFWNLIACSTDSGNDPLMVACY